MKLLPQDQVFWYLNEHSIKPLTYDISTDVLIIGGGMAGLTAAQAFHAKGKKVVLIEKNYCGAGASGKSSGFITPDSEISLFELMNMFGPEMGKKLWTLIGSGVTTIADNIKKYDIDCDYQVQDTLILANSMRDFNNDIKKEYENRQKAHYPSTLYPQDKVRSVIGSDGYVGGISYGGTFGIRAYHYCHGMKKVLQEQGVQIYEETPALTIQEKKVQTPQATIQAEHIIVCTDRFEPALSQALWDKVYHVQTFLMLSSPLSDADVKKIFPAQPYMVWDTAMIYNYYRLAGDNRLMLGGSDLLYTYGNESHNNERVAKKLIHYFRTKFPSVPVEFEYIWPGIIGISKDVFPVAGFDEKMPSVYYIAGACGLPFAAALATHCVDRIVNNNTEFDTYFSPYRSFTFGPITQKILGTRLTFALSNFFAVGSL
jgi:gamma-glutamylputrescine oxidase